MQHGYSTLSATYSQLCQLYHTSSISLNGNTCHIIICLKDAENAYHPPLALPATSSIPSICHMQNFLPSSVKTLPVNILSALNSLTDTRPWPSTAGPMPPFQRHLLFHWKRWIELSQPIIQRHPPFTISASTLNAEWKNGKNRHDIYYLHLPFVLFSFQHNDFAFDCLMLSICSAIGQLFIYYTIEKFGAVVFIIIMTIRQVWFKDFHQLLTNDSLPLHIYCF